MKQQIKRQKMEQPMELNIKIDTNLDLISKTNEAKLRLPPV